MSSKQRPPIRNLAHLFSVFHNITYYAEEMRVFQTRGIEKYWHGYLAYRSAPMGEVTAPTACATFYNFSPALVHAAIPNVWTIISPEEAIQIRDDAMHQALQRIFEGPGSEMNDSAAKAADLTLASLAELPVAGRALFGAYSQLSPPDEPLRRAWHAATLWREYRGDNHNIALAAEGIDGIECHVLLAGKGVASQEIIGKIRGWDADSWSQAHDRLAERSLITEEGKLTPSGDQLRRHIEDLTDRLSMAPLERLQQQQEYENLVALLQPLVDVVLQSGVVPDRWPPPRLSGTDLDS
ncbi:MAG: SCO6745 family protein [Acidimicrobiales bacterium]